MAVEKRQIAVGIDAGSSFTRCVVLKIEDGLLTYLGHGEAESAGFTKSRLVDHMALQPFLRKAIEEAEKAVAAVEALTIDSLVIGTGGIGISGCNGRGLYEFGRPHRITQAEISFAVERAANVRLQDDRILLHLLPQDFTLDGRAGYRHPVGSSCSRLEANVYLIEASHREHEMLLAAAHEAHVMVEETVFEPLASAYAAILPDERSRGIALIDIGAQSTGLVVYDGEAVVLAKSLPLSAGHFTRDVAYGLKVAYEDAERLKLEYGCAMIGLTGDNSLIEVPTPEGRASREAPRRLLNEILEARAEELFGLVREQLVRIGMERSLGEGVVLTGGGALLNGMCDMAERVLNCPARNGLVIGIEHWPDDLNLPTWTAAGGLAMYFAMLKSRQDRSRKAPGLVGLLK